MLEYRDVYAGGRLIPSVSPDVITVVNPATEEIAGTVPAAAAADVDASVSAVRRAFDDGGWALGPRADRADAMERLASALDDRAEDTARLVTAETGMPIRFSRIHNGMAPSAILRYYASLARGLALEEFRGAISFPGQTLVRREPVGVTAVMAPWNYPLTLAFAQLAPALAVGCTAVLKPATQTSLSAYILTEAFEAADFPLGVFNMVTGGHDVAEILARHRGVDKVAFAGVVSAGRRIAAICGERLKPVSLELGGGDPAGRRRPQRGHGGVARVVTGGRRPAAPVRGYCYEPTVLAGAMPPPGAGEEVFGPVVTVVPYTGEAEAVALANDSECGLAVSVWTADAERGLEMARRTRAGTFGVNLYMPDLGAPWGDRRASGPASLYGPESLDAYVSAKSVFLKG